MMSSYTSTFDKDENEAIIAIYHRSLQKNRDCQPNVATGEKKLMFVPLIGSSSLSTPQQTTRVFK